MINILNTISTFLQEKLYVQINKKTKLHVKNFIAELKLLYPNLIINVEECEYNDGFIIWHNYANWADDNDDFGEIIYELFKKYFRNDGFFDVGFSYDFTLPTYIK